MKSKIELIGKDNLQKLLNESNTYGEVLEKIGLSVIANNFKTLKKYNKLFDLSTDLIDEHRRQSMSCLKYDEITFKESLENGTCTLKPCRILQKLIKYNFKQYRCEICGISTWNGKQIVLELHHKNGIHTDNHINNLEILCPNCHSQTENFRSKNIK